MPLPPFSHRKIYLVHRFSYTTVFTLLATSLFFGSIAEDIVTNHPLVQADNSVAAWIGVRTNAAGIAFMRTITELGGFRVVFTVSVLVGLFMIHRRAYKWLARLIVAVPGGMLFNLLLKILFGR